MMFLSLCNAFQNKLSPVQYILRWQERQLVQTKVANKLINQPINRPQECKIEWHYTFSIQK